VIPMEPERLPRCGTKLRLPRKWRKENGLLVDAIDYVEAGRAACLRGAPLWANPGIGTQADDWRRGYESGLIPALSKRDTALIVTALLSPPEPNDALRRAFGDDKTGANLLKTKGPLDL
jgi:hypothetical protein